jgi:formylglycine-generating enzyme
MADPALPPCSTPTSCSSQAGEGLSCASVKVNAASLYECLGYRLPTEAEWKYAARAGSTSALYSGNMMVYPGDNNGCYPDATLERIAWYCHNSGATTRQWD